jgi:hypothetical protein
MNPGYRRSLALHLTVAVFLAVVMACGGQTPTAPDTASLRFTSRVPGPGSGESVTAAAAKRRIAIRATLRGPDPCRTLEGELDQRNRELTLRVFVRPNSEVCVQIIGGFAYDAVIEGLPRGTYVLQVVHTYVSTGFPTQTVLNQTMNVR